KAFLQENSMNKYMTGIVEQVDIEKNFNLILDIHPDIKKLIIINDFSKTGQAIRRDLRNIIPKFKKRIKEIEYIDNMDMEDIKHKLKNAKKDTVILFVLLFKDKTGKFFTYKESLQEIKSVSKVPTYGLWDFYLDYGIIGGMLTSASAQGEAISNMALDVLNGKKIKDIPIIEKSPNRYMFDYNELRKFDIKIQDHLDDYIIVNQPFSFYREYRFLVNSTVILFIVFTILLISMRKNIQRRKIVEVDLSNQLKFDKVLLDTLPNPIYYKNIDGRFLGCNIAFANLAHHKRIDVIGKTAFDFFPRDIAIKNTNIDKQLLKTLGTHTSELTIHSQQDGMRYFILNKAVYLNIDGSIGGIVCIMDDITERVQQKQFLIQQSKLAEMGDMVAAIAHQWNEPLVELSAEVQEIELSYMLNELKDSQVKAFVKDSMIQIQYMSRTLSDFRNFLKPSTSKTLFGIRKALDEIFEIIGKQVFYSNIILSINYASEDENILLFGYENEFKQVLMNLINNAKNKIIDKNGSSGEKGNIIINVSSDNKYNTIEIIDDAGAIAQDVIGLIFDPYFTTKKEGTGLGLYMAKVIIEDKMSGKIKVKNDDNNVVFTIKLPNFDYDRLKK
ncbi:MAG: PAS domain-containing protein, partial [Campylobacteraceae bacterium]|nr:PAS domain-containing protein [Campylobacteraceae bacterium]